MPVDLHYCIGPGPMQASTKKRQFLLICNNFFMPKTLSLFQIIANPSETWMAQWLPSHRQIQRSWPYSKLPGVAPQRGHFFPQNAECNSSFNIDFKIIIFKDIIENCLNKNLYFITFIKILTFWLRKTPFLGTML